jgi:hypothetical protein
MLCRHFFEVQRGGLLKDFVFADGHYLLAIDGTGYFCSTNISCPHCLVKNRKSGKTEYSHQLVAAVLVHPSKDVVIPIAVEAIIQQDGSNKNDCERNADTADKSRPFFADSQKLAIENLVQ